LGKQGILTYILVFFVYQFVIYNVIWETNVLNHQFDLPYGVGFGLVIHPVKFKYVLLKRLPDIICEFFCLG